MKKVFFKGKPVRDDASKVCVLFDPKDGRVVHIHGVTTLDNRKSLSKAEVEKRTRENATYFGHSASGLKTLHVPISAIRQPGTLKVNSDGSALEPMAASRLRPSEWLAKRHRQPIRSAK
jgi:hypothetical protein